MFLPSGDLIWTYYSKASTVLKLQGLTPDEARANFWILDANGLITKRRENLTPTQEAFARSTTDPTDQEGESLLSVINQCLLS